MEDTFIIYQDNKNVPAVALLALDGTVWVSQTQMAEIFGTSVPNISYHISNILNSNELSKKSILKDYLSMGQNGQEYTIKLYSLEMILAVGFRIRTNRGIRFRQWANKNLAQYLRKGFVIDKERLKNPDGRPDYFDELLEQIQEIRASEKRFYQKVRDLFSLATDYDRTDKSTQMFFAVTQNKLLYAVTGETAADIIVMRASADKPNMGLTSWKGSKVRIGDITIAKNYLHKNEITDLNKLVSIFLDTAELQAKRKKIITMNFWQQKVDKLLIDNDYPLLSNAGTYSNCHMEKRVREIYTDFNNKRKKFEAIRADKDDIQELEQLSQNL